MTTKYIYDGKFKGNILVLGRTECGKQVLYKNWHYMTFLAN